MAGPVSSVTKVQAPSAVQPSGARQTAPAPKPQAPAADTVQISAAARVLQQRTEASAQTLEAAASGDLQARAQLAEGVPAHDITK